MELNDEQFDAISSEIIKKAGLFKCPVCGQNAGYNFSPTEFHVLAGERDSNGTGLSFGGQSTFLRVVAATCPHCAHISFFNLVRLEKNIAGEE